jgi:hypothetical protein
MSIVTTDDFSTYVTYPVADLAKVQSLIDRVEAVVRTYIRYNPARTNYMETYLLSPSDKATSTINLAHYPELDIWDIKIDGVTVDPTLLTIDSASGLLNIPSSMLGDKLYIDYDAGYDFVPEDIKDAICKTCAWEWSRMNASSYGIRTQAVGEATTSYEVDLPINIRNQLARYVHQNIFLSPPVQSVTFGVKP